MASKDKNAKKSMEKKPAQKDLEGEAAGEEGEEVAESHSASKALPRTARNGLQ